MWRVARGVGSQRRTVLVVAAAGRRRNQEGLINREVLDATGSRGLFDQTLLAESVVDEERAFG